MLTASIILGILGLVGGIISAGVSAGNNRANIEAQKEANEANIKMNEENNIRSQQLQELAYQQNVEQWNRENEYNLPSNQMARFKAAGLNPNLVYHQQNTAGTSPMMSYNAPVAGHVNPVISQGVDLSSLTTALTQLPKLYYDAKMMPYQLEIAKNQAEQSTISTKYLAEQIESELAFKRLSQDELIEKIASLKLGNQSFPERFHNEMAKVRAEIANTLWKNKLLVGDITARDLSNDALRIQNKKSALELSNYQTLFDANLENIIWGTKLKQQEYELKPTDRGFSRLKGYIGDKGISLIEKLLSPWRDSNRRRFFNKKFGVKYGSGGTW